MGNRVLIIAEAGVNHNGDINLAKKLIEAAIEAGVDIVKFQTFRAENLVTPDAVMAEYQVNNTQKIESQFEMLKRLELTNENFIELQRYAQERGIGFLSTGFDIDGLQFLKSLNMGLWKIPSGELTNLPYLEFIGACKIPVILSTGMADLKEVEEALHILIKAGTPKSLITVLHCNTDYPAQFSDVHLRAMISMKTELGVEVGYSDHTLGTEVSIAAVAMGAKIIEKHFTLDKNFPGPDHKASLDPHELKNLVTQIRHIELALGESEKKPSRREVENIKVARKSIVAKKDIAQGEIFTSENLTTKRPGTGLSPMKWHAVLGQVSSRNYKKDELIE